MNLQGSGALAKYLLALGDDELILAQRDSEWTGHAPILEEDIAFGNIALDELGHAVGWYRIVAELRGEDPQLYPDWLAYQRSAEEFRNARLVELPNGDWGFTVVRHYLFDAAEAVRLEALVDSDYDAIAELAAKIRTEELYHLRHLQAWVLRLGLGTEESHRRMQRALDQLYPMAHQLFMEAEAALVERGQVPDPEQLRQDWEAEVSGQLERSALTVPAVEEPPESDRREHTEHLQELVAELQQVAGQHEGATW